VIGVVPALSLVIGVCSDTICIDLATAGDGTCDRALAIGFPGSGRTVPFLLAMVLLVEARAAVQAIHAGGILARPEGQQASRLHNARSASEGDA